MVKWRLFVERQVASYPEYQVRDFDEVDDAEKQLKKELDNWDTLSHLTLRKITKDA